ncbi:sulfurtransferase-like selenium metabolism protein YedF [Desulfonatronum parangueonense]
MDQKNLDCRGLPCPQPVVQCKHSIDQDKPEEISILVDNEAARQNVTRFLKSQGYHVDDQQESDNVWLIKGSFEEGSLISQNADQAEPPAQPANETRTLVFLSAPGIGVGDPALGEKLMVNFLATLPELGTQLWRMILVNGAVKLAAEDHPCLESLQKLEGLGVTILVCGTCLTHFGLMEKKAVGQTTNMLDVVTSLQMAGKVIRP